MKIRQFGFLLLLIMFSIIPMPAIARECSVLFLADMSGSMQDKIEFEGEKLKKSDLLKLILIKTTQCGFEIYQIRHIAGDSKMYEEFDTAEVINIVGNSFSNGRREEFMTDYPVFNRRTPLADALHQLDEQELKKINGKTTLLLVSDGRESFRDPVAEVRKIKEKYGSALILHTVFTDREENKNKDSEGEKLLKDMAAAGGGKHYFALDLLKDDSLITELNSLLCEKN
jgi:hypothetical protein